MQEPSHLSRLQALLNANNPFSLIRPSAHTRQLEQHTQVLRERLRSGGGAHVPESLQEEAVKRFWPTMQLEGFRDTRLVAFGVGIPVGPQRHRVIEDASRLDALLSGVDKFLPEPRLYRKCYQGLMRGYFSYDPYGQHTPKSGQQNWEALRQYLDSRAERTLGTGVRPQWTDTLQVHKTLFSRDPSGRYGAKLLAGDDSEVTELREVLSIMDNTWFMKLLYLAQVREATKKPDREFLSLLHRLIEMLHHGSGTQALPEGMALLLDRYAEQAAPAMSPALCDSVVNLWGNPWLELNAMRWGRVSTKSRQLATEWLKLQYIEDFFTLLAEEGTGDERRLEFWKRYAKAMNTVYFALGSDARNSTSRDFQALRKKIKGLSLDLQDSARKNNAFIMEFKDLVVVEFSNHANACYGYTSSQAPVIEMGTTYVTRVDAQNSLKLNDHVMKLTHMDGAHQTPHWETRFELELAKHGVHPVSSAQSSGYTVQRTATAPSPVAAPSSAPSRAPAHGPNASDALARALARPPAPAPRPRVPTARAPVRKPSDFSTLELNRFAALHSLTIANHTGDNGNLWVRADDSRPEVSNVLRAWNFEYKNPSKGWWWKGP